MDDQRTKETWNEILRQAGQEQDIELEATVLGLAMTIATATFEDEVRELLIRGAALIWCHTDRFNAGETPLMT